MTLNNITIGKKLALAFGLLLITMTAVIGFGLKNMNEMKNRLDIIVNENNTKTRLSNEMANSVHVEARVLRTLVLLNDPEAIAREKLKIDNARLEYANAWNNLQKLPVSEQGKQIRASIQSLLAEAQVWNNKVYELAMQQRDTEAVDLLLNQARPANRKLQDALDKNIKRQEELSKASYLDALKECDTAYALLFGLGSTAIILGIGAAIFITRSITLPMQQAIEMAEKVALGDLTQSIDVSGTDETGLLLAALKKMNTNLKEIVGQVRSGTETISTAASQIASGNLDLSSRTEEQASSLEQTAASMEELTSTVKQNADNAIQANQLAVAATENALKGGDVVHKVTHTMHEINESSAKVAKIISVIDGIAFQTNILALNAAVEAARAGEQGRGFAVVASEVRALAQRSSSAAREIKDLITSSVEKVQEGSKFVVQAETTMEEIVTSVKHVADIMSEITAASREQSIGIEQVNQAISQMDQVTQQNAALVEEAAAAAESMQEQTNTLVKLVNVFKLGENISGLPHSTATSPVVMARIPAPQLKLISVR